jgi:benzodiazapine receptor
MNIIKLAVSILICLAAGSVGSIFTTPSIPNWYASLQKPSFNPPNWVFGPVWTTLFVLMGISLYIVWSRGLQNKKIRKAIFVFGLQLLLNILWSILFFGLKSPLLAFLEIIILWFAISITIIQFFKISKGAGLLLLPYILWVSFASILNFFIVKLN